MAVYADHEDIAAYLGRTLSAEQQTQATLYASAASAFIDRRTGVEWATPSPVTENIMTRGPIVYLKHLPVIAVVSIDYRDLYPGSVAQPLTDGVSYELLDAQNGVLSLHDVHTFYNNVYRDTYIAVTYTHSAVSAPDNIKLAATLIAAHYMINAISPMGQRVKSMNDNRAINVTFRDADIPAHALMLLPPRRIHIA